MIIFSGGNLRAAVAAALLAVLPAVATDAAGEQSYPRLGGTIVIEMHNDWTYRSDDRDAELNDLSTLTEPELVLWFLPGLSLKLHGVLQPVQSPGARDDRVFEDHGLFVEELLLAYQRGAFFVFGGKFTPNFGKGWAATPGVYGSDFAEAGYELAERTGLGGGVTLDAGGAGLHTVSASTFFLDTSVLSKSAFANRGRTRLSDGGVSNTEDFASFAVALDGKEFATLPGFAYHAAFVRQAKGRDGASAETGVALAGAYSRRFGEIEIAPFVEYVKFNDLGGVSGRERDFLTVAVQFTWNRWNLAVAHTGRDTEAPGGGRADDALFQISVGYAFDFGVTADLGWRHTEESGVDTGTLGVLFAYTVEF